MIGYYLLAAGTFLGVALIILAGELSMRRHIRLMDEVLREDEPPLPAAPPLPEPASVDDLHAKFHDMGEIDPKKAGWLKYVEQLARHGQ